MSHHERRLERLEKLAVKMDSAFRIPVIGMRVGWDAIIGLVPGIGDLLGSIPAVLILAEAKRMGASPEVLGRMGLNTTLDFLIGSIPIIGDLFDAKFKSNRRNVQILRRHLHEKGAVRLADSPILTT